MKTCPGAWSIPGEHRHAGETTEMNVARGLREELGDDVMMHIRVSKNLTAGYRWYYREYGDGRKDRQLTEGWLILLDAPHGSVRFKMDDEVADSRWVPASDWLNWVQDSPLSFCHETVSTLFEAVQPAFVKAMQEQGLCEGCKSPTTYPVYRH